MFFLSKSLCGHAISCQKHLELPVVSYLLIDLFYIGMPANGRMVNRTGIHSHDYQNFLDRWITNFSITKISRIDGLPIFLRYGAPLARAELQYKDRKWVSIFSTFQLPHGFKMDKMVTNKTVYVELKLPQQKKAESNTTYHKSIKGMSKPSK